MIHWNPKHKIFQYVLIYKNMIIAISFGKKKKKVFGICTQTEPVGYHSSHNYNHREGYSRNNGVHKLQLLSDFHSLKSIFTSIISFSVN